MNRPTALPEPSEVKRALGSEVMRAACPPSCRREVSWVNTESYPGAFSWGLHAAGRASLLVVLSALVNRCS